MNLQKYFALIVLLLFLTTIINASVCIGVAGGGYKLDVTKNKPAYLTFTVYDKDPDPKTICSTGIYSLELSTNDQNVNSIVNYSFSENDFILNNSETKSVMLTLNPLLDSGTYTINVKVKMAFLDDVSGTKIKPTTSTNFILNFSNSGNNSFSNTPDWYKLQISKNRILFIVIISSVLGLIIILIILFFLIKHSKRHKHKKKFSY